MVFAIPYEGRFTLVGTTDVAVDAPSRDLRASSEEVDYLLRALGGYFERPVSPDEVVWSYAGVRPLHDDGRCGTASAVTRDYRLEVDGPPGGAPLLSVYGGKITTFRRLGEHALALLQPRLGVSAAPWTRTARLPGGDLPDDFEAFRAEVARERPWIGEPALTRLCRAYGSRLPAVLDGARSWAALGRDFGAGLTEREAAYLKGTEWAADAEDVLWRRSKLGLHMSKGERLAFAAAFPSL